jgi:type IV secretory pathway protease TraF
VGEQIVVQPVQFNASHKVPVGLWAVAVFHGRSLLVKPPHWQGRRRQPMA